MTEGAMPSPNQMTGQMLTQLIHSKWSLLRRKSLARRLLLVLGLLYFLLQQVLALFVFFQRNKLGRFVGNCDNAGLVYDLSGKSQNLLQAIGRRN
ncbi:MAG: hypothetical protein ACLUFP_02255 [Streptococcus salivarius]